ncbi:MAG: hypothetical protein QOF78_787 [Phycisphaerales bacterium]|nr:hypothetical protein [Phycisphaerales bacterium]
MDVQAVGAGARAIYELYLDLRWFKSKPDEVYLHRFREYSDVDRYMTGKKVVDRRGDSNSLLTDADIQPIIAGLQALDEKARRKGHASMRDLVLKFWGANGVDEPKWPSHWSGEGNLRSRAKAIGPECLDEYYQIYPTLCALVHPGPTPEVGLGLSDPLWRESLVSFSYGHAYRLARSATDIFIDLVEVRHHLKGYDAAVRQLDIWEQDAKRTMPAW